MSAMVKMTINFTILLMVAVNTCHGQSKCATTEMCELDNTLGLSNNSLVIPRSSIYPGSCSLACFQRADCIATTYDSTTETCDMHIAEADGTLCINVSANVGSAFTMAKWSDIPCSKVRRHRKVKRHGLLVVCSNQFALF